MATSMNDIKSAIQNREKLNVVHQTTNSDGSPKAGHALQYREVIPVAVGRNPNTGNDLVRVYQTGGGTNKSPATGYKLLKLQNTLIEPSGDEKLPSSHFNARSTQLLSSFRSNDSAFNQLYSMASDDSTWDTGTNITSSTTDDGATADTSPSTFQNPFTNFANKTFKRKRGFGSRLVQQMRNR